MKLLLVFCNKYNIRFSFTLTVRLYQQLNNTVKVHHFVCSKFIIINTKDPQGYYFTRSLCSISALCYAVTPIDLDNQTDEFIRTQ